MKNNITCIIVDDEKEAREGLALMVQEIDDLELIDTCRNGIEAIEKINEFRPDLLLLDIQMPYIDGFEVLQNVKHKPPAIIFITAYDEYALKAFEVHAVDYLLKPFNDDRFFEAIEHAKEKIRHKKGEDKFTSLLKKTEFYRKQNDSVIYDPGTKKSSERIIIKADGKIHFVPVEDIKWIEAYDYYIKIHVEGQYFLIRDTMKNMIKKLPEKYFIRIHKSSIVNTKHILQIENINTTEVQVILISGEQLKVSRNFKPDLIKKLN